MVPKCSWLYSVDMQAGHGSPPAHSERLAVVSERWRNKQMSRKGKKGEWRAGSSWKGHLEGYLTKLSPTQGTMSYYSSGNQNRAERTSSAEHLCSDEKSDQQKDLFRRASRREHSRKRFTPSSLVPAVLANIVNEEQWSPTAKHFRQLQVAENNWSQGTALILEVFSHLDAMSGCACGVGFFPHIW